MITERGAGVLIGAAFAWLLGRFLGVPELYVLAAGALVLTALAVAAVWLSAGRIEVDRTVSPTRVAWGRRTQVTVTLRNRGRLATGLLLVVDEVPFTLADGPRFVLGGLAREQETAVGYELSGATRGRYLLGPALLRLRDPFGLAERARRVGERSELVVYPRLEHLGHGVPAAPRQGEGGSRRRTLLHSGDEFSTIREWHAGDDIRLVHWPSSAHRARLMVRQFEQPYEPQATLLCDTRSALHRGAGPDSTVETAISATASVSELLARFGHRLRLLLPDDAELVQAEPQRIMDRLAEAVPSQRPSLSSALALLSGRAGGGLLIAVLAPPAGAAQGIHPDILALLAAGRGYSVRIALIVDTAAASRTGRPAAAMAAALHAGGWRTVTHRPGAPLADSWRRVAGSVALAAGGA
jgi:uncharacterized protein (DUF58 family)